MAGTDDRIPIDREKHLLRVRMERARTTWASAAKRAGREALLHLEGDERWGEASYCGLFAATSGEPDMRPIFEALIARGTAVVLPRCVDGHRLEFAPIDAWDDLEPGRYGLLEPVSKALGGTWRPGDLVFVPGVAFDRAGGRLGRGYGYYDRSFGHQARGRPWLVGVGLELQIVEHVPMESFDRRMDGILTDAGLQWFD
jgi:5-formyltetrahydrofolate cyclo-ligase